MRFVTYRTVETEPRLGLVDNGLVIDVEYFGAAIGQDLPPRCSISSTLARSHCAF